MTKKRLIKAKDDFVTLARMTQEELKQHLTDALIRHGLPVVTGDGFLYARGETVLLTAHIDTVHKESVKKVIATTTPGDIYVKSPQGIGGDDRSGVFIIMHLLPRLLAAGVRPAVLFCEDEEIGGVGSAKFCATPDIKDLEKLCYLIELDRANSSDAVFYDDDNRAFHKYITTITGYKEAHGSFSDISNLCPACGRSGVNLSVGYYDAHTVNEEVSVREMLRTADVVEKLITDTRNNPVQYDYIETQYRDYFGGYYGGYYGAVRYFEVLYMDTDGTEKESMVEGETLEEAAGAFLMGNPAIRWADVLDVFEL